MIPAMDGHLSQNLHGKTLLLSLCTLKSCNSIDKIQPRMMVGIFSGNPSTTIIFCYIPTNARNETGLITFYYELSSLVRSIPKHNVLIISADMNAQIAKEKNNKYSLHNSSHRNGEGLTKFSLENRLTCLNTEFQKKKGKLLTYTNANDTKTQIDYILMNKIWINS